MLIVKGDSTEALGASALRYLKYSRVRSVKGGLKRAMWKKAGVVGERN